MATVSPAPKVDRKLQMREVLDWLVEDGMLSSETAERLLHDSRAGKGGNKHPIYFLTEARLRSQKASQGALSAEVLAEWLAGRLNMQYFRIDPLKIDLRAVTQVMS